MPRFPGSVLSEMVETDLKATSRIKDGSQERDQLIILGEDAPEMAREILRLRKLLTEKKGRKP